MQKFTERELQTTLTHPYLAFQIIGLRYCKRTKLINPDKTIVKIITQQSIFKLSENPK
jgi:hypothetical protein